ncbi:hypothetical protein SAMN05660772_02839 [Pasteurella testudinis DSM 23072]|uniref:Uncharacterized protein n=2 Tax=Pasteurella testudinis TaxID=761 RepID=A0A1W1V5Q1_9PAST|nr:hypothetical protein SAMN05660772_02839 [Pasteurella testudinis DSM 23072]SUB51586.1 Uncharacterised protein [Pasteurella testudinis]
MTKDEVLSVLKKHKFDIYRNIGFMIWSTRGDTYLVYTFENINQVVSVSFNRKPNIVKSTKVMRELFGERFTHLKSHPMDGVNCNYFRLETLN